MSAVEEAFRWARIHAVRHMAACEKADLRWGETAVTEVLIARSAEAVRVMPFTQHAEAKGGADWIWWWVDTRGAYGMLVQAKRVKVSRGRWKFDFEYSSGSGGQRSRLMGTANQLNVVPAYALYLGTGAYRNWERCSDSHRSGRCLHCVKRSVSLMPALLAESTSVNDAQSTYGRSVALEDLWEPPNPIDPPIISALHEEMAPDLAKFLTTAQSGSMAVSRSMLDKVLAVRFGQLQTATATPVEIPNDAAHDELGPIFGQVPDDQGHWGTPYFKHILGPLRQAPPDYVLEILAGNSVEESTVKNMPEGVAGVAVVQLISDA